MMPPLRRICPVPRQVGHVTHQADAGKSDADKNIILANTALQRAGKPQEIAEVVRWLIEDAKYCTGEIVRVDGGRHLNI